MTKLISQCPNSFNARSYAEIIKDKSRRRLQVAIANQIAKGAHNGGVDISKVVGQLVDTTEIKKKADHLSDGLSEYYDYISERFANPKKVWGIHTGYPEIDNYTGGLHKKHVLMISGAPGAGKSILAAYMILQSAKQGTRWAVYSLEMAREDLINRWVAIMTGLNEDDLSSGTFTQSKWDDINNAIELLESLPIYINDMAGMTTTEIKSDVARLQAEGGLDAVCVDYLELLGDTAESSNEATAKKSRNFREICKGRNLAGVIIQSMTKEGIGAATGGITSGSQGKKSFVSAQSAIIGVRGPADVGHDADTIFMVVTDPADETGKTIALLPVKKRHGSGGKKPIRFKWHEKSPYLVEQTTQINFTPNR
jgi:replicative DNA helicase